MTQLWTIADRANGSVLCVAFPTPSAGSHPKDNGWGWDAATQMATRIDGAPDPAIQRWTGSAWVDDPVKVEAILLASIKAEAERRKMLWLSPGGAKKAEYAEKRAEVAFWDSLGGTVTAILAAVSALSAAARAAKFSYAIADAAAFGEPNISAAIERFRAGMSAASKVPAVAAAEAKTCAAIKAATTATAKRTAAAAILWP